jgi:hypothetical protein
LKGFNMTIPSRVMGSGNAPLSTQSICGVATTGLTAAGSSATDALQLSNSYSVVGTTAASTGVKLVSTENGATVVVANDGASTLTVYPKTGSTIDGAASVSIATGKRRVFWGTSDTTWVSLLGA